MSDDDEKREEFQRDTARMHDQMMKRVGPDSRDTFDDIERRAEESELMLIRALLRGRLPDDKFIAEYRTDRGRVSASAAPDFRGDSND